jgi:hypothetical protein
MALMVSWALGGCRFGNHVETPPDPDQISGYYATSPQSLTFCASHGTTSCAPAAPNLVPDTLADAMSNPVALILQDLESGSAYLASTAGTGAALPVFASPDGVLSFLGSTGKETLWRDPACTTQLFIEEDGTWTKSANAGTSASGKPLSGRVQLRIQIIRTIDGTCGPTLQEIADCYANASLCGGADATENAELQAAVQYLFNDYIQSGTMASTDIPNVSALAYEVSYE